MKTFLFFSQIIFLKNKQIIQMAEGGFDEFENPAFDRDDYDADVDTYLTDLFGENQETQRIAEQQMESMEHLSGETLEDTRKK